MKILVIGGTRFFGIHMVNALLSQDNDVTLATRGNTNNVFGDKVSYITVERTNPDSMKNALFGKHFDIVIDKVAYCSNDIKYALDVLNCDKYIHMSSTAVYEPKHIETLENEYNPNTKKLVWCSRTDFAYDEIKRQAENALYQAYPNQKSIAVRYPFVIGKDDYTKRLLFYVEYTIKGLAMYIDNIDCQVSFIESIEAGKFMAYLATADFTGAINGCSFGTISIKEIIQYVEGKCGVKAILSLDGDKAPYNGEPEYSINTDLARSIGYKFSNLKDWIYELIDYYIAIVKGTA
ncbi:MAG: NAD-dependent epimerase/dehydratase family protein [Eubacteriales bacterium]|nr:NAD-dependent epimerase/dehydratase family protein [Eubacteriales bacterium]